MNNSERNQDRDIKYGISMNQTKYVPLKCDLQKIIDNMATEVNGLKKLNLIPGAKYNFSDIAPNGKIFLDKDDIMINGNNATILNDKPYLDAALFQITGNDITIRDINFEGHTAEYVVDMEMNSKNSGIVVYKTFNTIIENCSFQKFTGYGIVLAAHSSNWDYYKAAAKIKNNHFEGNFIGLANLYRFEYSVSEGNTFYKCNIGLLDSSGNWSHNGNSIIKCNIPYLATSQDPELIQKDRNGTQLGLQNGNWAHGQINNMITNHSLDGRVWTTTILKLINGGTYNWTTFKGQSVVYAVIPPQFIGLTLYYSAIHFIDIVAGTTTYKIVGTTLSGQSSAIPGAIRASAPGLIEIIGLTKQNTNVVLVNVVERGA